MNETAGATTTFSGFRKRNGMAVPFRRDKIETAVYKAADAVARRNGGIGSKELAASITSRVLAQLDNPLSEYFVPADLQGLRTPRIEDVQDLVEIVLMEAGEAEIAATYKRYRKQRDRARDSIRVRDPNAKTADPKKTPWVVDVPDAGLKDQVFEVK